MSAQEQLASLQALTDTTLTALDVDDLLDELLRRVQEALDADTAAVLLLAKGGDELVATAARGLEEEVREGFRVPLGVGFAGRIASTQRPNRLDRVDATTVANPILWEKGVEAMLGVPLLSAGRLLGVLHVGRLEKRTFTDHDVALLQVAADRVAGAIQGHNLSIERAAAALLERSLLPDRLPSYPGLELSARYAPAEGQIIGGDWYDVFTLPSGTVWIVVGDVAGHGIEASIVMGRIRSALRAYTLLDIPMEEVLRLVDRKVEHFEIGTIATVVCATTDPPFDTVKIALAGHPPPVIAYPDRPAEVAAVHPGPPLGCGSRTEYSSRTFEMTPGTTIALYTDGLIERRDEPIDAGIERLRAAISPLPADQATASLVHSLVGKTKTYDDIALVVLRRIATTDSRARRQ